MLPPSLQPRSRRIAACVSIQYLTNTVHLLFCLFLSILFDLELRKKRLVLSHYLCLLISLLNQSYPPLLPSIFISSLSSCTVKCSHRSFFRSKHLLHFEVSVHLLHLLSDAEFYPKSVRGGVVPIGTYTAQITTHWRRVHQ